MPKSASEHRPTRNRRRGYLEYWGGTNGEPPDEIGVLDDFRLVTFAPSDTEKPTEETDTHETDSDGQSR